MLIFPGSYRGTTGLLSLLSLTLAGCFTYTDSLLLEGASDAAPGDVSSVDEGPFDESIDSGTSSLDEERGSVEATDGPSETTAEASPAADAAEGDDSSRSADAGSGEATCPGDYALQLPGSVYGTIARIIQDDFTIEAWIKMTTSLTGTGFWEGSAIAYADQTALGASDFAFTVMNDKLWLGTGKPDTTITSTSKVATGRWVHVATTRSKATGSMVLLVNGVVEASTTGGTTSLTASTTIAVAGRSGGNLFVGSMDELRIWKVVRTTAEISSNMHRRLQGNEAGLVGYYRFDENGGTVALDSSPSKNNAALSGPAAWIPSDAPLCN